MKHSAALAHLRSLVGLRLPGEMFIPALLEDLHGVIPCYRNLFDWTDPQGRLMRYDFEGPSDAPTHRAGARGDAAADGDDSAAAPCSELWRPDSLAPRLEACVRGPHGNSIGSLVLYRGPDDRHFTRADEHLLAQVLPYVERGLQPAAIAAAPREYASRAGRSGVLSLSLQGELLHLSRGVLKLLLKAHDGITPHSASRSPRAADFATLVALCARHANPGGEPRSQVATSVENPRGRFRFESELLRGVDGRAADLIHVTIHHDEPRSLGLRRVLAALSLTPAQREVALQMQDGLSQQAIATAMAVAPSTIADHVKKIYTRLDVHSTQELTQLLNRLIGAPLRPAGSNAGCPWRH